MFFKKPDFVDHVYHRQGARELGIWLPRRNKITILEVKVDALNEALASCSMAGPASVELVTGAELELGVDFPASYRAFLMKYGAVTGRGFSIAGLFSPAPKGESPLWIDVVTNTKQLRRASRGRIPQSYVAIADDGGDCKFYIETSTVDARGESPIIGLGPGSNGVVVADTFTEFAVRLSQEIEG